jgi:dipeptidyl aminopeptidase/acylaminoacyl peptidase
MQNIKINHELSASLFIPEKQNNNKPHPALIFIHGWRSNRQGNNKRAEAISKLGYICLTLDLRGHGDSAGTIDQFSRQDHLDDIKHAYKYLANLDNVDKSKISIVGASYGGYLAAVSTNYLQFSKLALRVPALYFDDNFDTPSDKLIRGDTKAFKTSGLTSHNSLALKGIANFKGDILIVESEKDTVIPHDVIENYLEVIKDKSKLTYKVMKDAEHSLSTNEQENDYIQILKNWI